MTQTDVVYGRRKQSSNTKKKKKKGLKKPAKGAAWYRRQAKSL